MTPWNSLMTAVFYGWWRGADGKVSAEVVVEKGRAPCGWEFLEVEGATNRVRFGMANQRA